MDDEKIVQLFWDRSEEVRKNVLFCLKRSALLRGGCQGMRKRRISQRLEQYSAAKTKILFSFSDKDRSQYFH